MAEMTQVSEQPADAAVSAPRDHVPEFLALGWFVGVLLIGAGLAVIEFRIPEAVTKVGPWVVAIAFVLYLRLSVPSAKLVPARRAQRDDRRAGGIIGVLSACTVLGAIAAATYLTSWADWVVLGSFVTLTIGGAMMLHVRFTIGS